MLFSTIDEFAKMSGFTKSEIFFMQKFTHFFYYIFHISKANRSLRQICAPKEKLKEIQEFILENILSKIKPSKYAFAFIKNRNTFKNSKKHLNKKYILKIDIKDFFQTINFKKVKILFLKLGYNGYISQILARLCTLNKRVPQGAITSPAISNAILKNFDYKVADYLKDKRVIYTRYADDLIFSCNNLKTIKEIKKVIIRFIMEEGFEINKEKIKIMRKCDRQKITGLIVNSNRVRIGRKKLRELRAKIHKYVLLLKEKKEDEKLKNNINGWLAYLQTVDKQSKEIILNYIKNIYKKYSIDFKQSEAGL